MGDVSLSFDTSQYLSMHFKQLIDTYHIKCLSYRATLQKQDVTSHYEVLYFRLCDHKCEHLIAINECRWMTLKCDAKDNTCDSITLIVCTCK